MICPICHSEYKKFGSYGHPLRENAYCYECMSLERHRLVWKFINDYTDLLQAGGRLLHFAPERCLLVEFLNRANIEYYPCDLNPELYEEEDISILKADMTDMPFTDNFFDAAVCNHILEHIPDDRKAMSELYRVLKPGGWGIFQVPIDYNREFTYEDSNIVTEADRLKAFGQEDHVRIYGRDYITRLKSAGFVVTEGTYPESDIIKYGFQKSERVYFCQKYSTP